VTLWLDRAGGWLERCAGRFRGPSAAAHAGDGWLVALVALVLRAAVVVYAADRFPPADDGSFYHVVAGRIAQGLGYTWQWPDGAETFAAHYPVGYPALLAGGYALFGARPVVAMALNALVGAAGAWGAHALAARCANRRGAAVAGLLVALEPALVAYTPALMTEAVAGGLVLLAAVCATGGRRGLLARGAATGLLLGLSLLVRPQLLLVAPFVGALLVWQTPSVMLAARAGLAITAISVAVCLPWTLRNCARLDTCAFVSANGGWNLYIGSSPLGRGGWAPVDQIGVPEECRTVFGEGAKDRCFGRAGLRVIAAHPARWLGLVPQKLGVTFDYGTAAAHYLSTSNPALVADRAKLELGAVELFGQRVLLVAAVSGLGLAAGPGRLLRRRLAPVAVALSLVPFAWVGWLVLVLEGALFGRALLRLPSALLAVSLVAATALTHAVFFGGGRYALVCLPALAAVSGLLFPREPVAED
jgi:hypothetical protein